MLVIAWAAVAFATAEAYEVYAPSPVSASVAPVCAGHNDRWQGAPRELSARPHTLDAAVRALSALGDACDPGVHAFSPLLLGSERLVEGATVHHLVRFEQRLSDASWAGWVWTLDADYRVVGYARQQGPMSSYPGHTERVLDAALLPHTLAQQISDWSSQLQACPGVVFDYPHLHHVELRRNFGEVDGYRVVMHQTVDPDLGQVRVITRELDRSAAIQSTRCSQR